MGRALAPFPTLPVPAGAAWLAARGAPGGRHEDGREVGGRPGIARAVGRTLAPMMWPWDPNICSSVDMVIDGCRRRTMSVRMLASAVLGGAGSNDDN